MASNTTTSPICARLPPDLDAALRQRADAEGVTVTELMRAIAYRYVYGATSNFEEGYAAGRSLALQLTHYAMASAISDAFAEHIPQTYEEALAILQASNVHRRG